MPKHVVMIIANSPNPSYFRWFAELNYSQKACRLSFIFLYTEMPQLADEVKQYGVNSHFLFFDTYKSKPFQYLKMFFSLYLLFRKLNPNCIQTNLFDDSLPALLAARLAGVKKRIITKQDTGFHINYKPAMVKFDRFNNFNATDLIAVSQESKEIIVKNERGNSHKITLIHHGVDEKFITSAGEEDIQQIKNKFNPTGKILIGTIARYIPSKGYTGLIHAAALVIKKHPECCFIGFGHGTQQEELQKLINELGLEKHFLLAGLVDYSLIPAVYKNLSIYVHPARLEPFGFVIAEAMFNKIPIVTTRVGASRDVLVHGQSAYLVNYDMPEEIAAGIEYILENDISGMTNNAFVLAQNHFSRENMWNRYKELFLS